MPLRDPPNREAAQVAGDETASWFGTSPEKRSRYGGEIRRHPRYERSKLEGDEVASAKVKRRNGQVSFTRNSRTNLDRYHEPSVTRDDSLPRDGKHQSTGRRPSHDIESSF